MGDQECAGGHTLLGNIFPQTIVEREMYVRLRNLETLATIVTSIK